MITVEGEPVIDPSSGGVVAFTHRDCAGAFVAANPPTGALQLETLPGPDMFKKLAAVTSVKAVVWNPSGPANAVVLPMGNVQVLAQVLYSESRSDGYSPTRALAFFKISSAFSS